jgi:hypothetical protein
MEVVGRKLKKKYENEHTKMSLKLLELFMNSPSTAGKFFQVVPAIHLQQNHPRLLYEKSNFSFYHRQLSDIVQTHTSGIPDENPRKKRKLNYI